MVPRVVAATTVEEKNTLLCNGVYEYFSTKYGTRSQKRAKYKKPRGGRKSVAKLREMRNQARKELRKAKKDVQDPQAVKDLANKFHQYLRQHNRARRAESNKFQRKQEMKARKECAKNFWSFAARVLEEEEDKNDTQPTFERDVAEQFFSSTYSSVPKVFQQPSWLPGAASPQTEFDTDSISPEEIQAVITKSRGRSSPSPLDQVPYLVFKHCPSLTTALVDLFNSCWQEGVVPRGWKQGVIRLIPKASAKEAPDTPTNFRPIALTSCVGKLFTTVLKNRWLTFMTLNGYLDTSIQKAFLPGIPGYLEQYEKLSAAIGEAHKRHRSLTVCWLDLANAYGSVHHSLIKYALEHYHAPSCFLRIMSNL